ncbi:hypothetical protein AB0K48_01820 [Nonomuraea sp. NPDC055795]
MPRNDNPVTYTITVAASGLVSKVSSSYAANILNGHPRMQDETLTIVSTYTGWGKKVSIKAPHPSTVTTQLKD